MSSPPWHRLWLRLQVSDLDIERRQCRDEGRDLTGLETEFDRVAQLDLATPEGQREARELLDRCALVPLREDLERDEPSDLEGIRAARGPAVELAPLDLRDDELLERTHAAWTARCAGCLLGKPVEGWHRAKVRGFLQDSGRWPLRGYFSREVPAGIRQRYQLAKSGSFVEDVTCMPEDDDLNYTVLALALMEHHGFDFTPRDVATFWMQHLPVLHACTAERVAYRNLCLDLDPPASATFRNPYREWIGAQIRGDLFGYVAPGDPELAAELAWRDASVSHVKNGIYGEMWAAATIAAAFVTRDVTLAIRAGLAQVPARSRLATALGEVLQWKTHEDLEYDTAVDRIHRRWDETDPHDWCHVIPNAALVVVALLWGDQRLGTTICRAVEPCFDTDCNGATAGSILGAAQGPAAMDAAWSDPLHDTLETGVAGFTRARLQDLAHRTRRIAQQRR